MNQILLLTLAGLGTIFPFTDRHTFLSSLGKQRRVSDRRFRPDDVTPFAGPVPLRAGG